MPTNYTTLSKFINETPIPEVRGSFGFLELIKKQMHENINSQIYAHFLGCNIPEIRDAFLGGLLDVISKKSDIELDIIEPLIQTEVTTQSVKRIDIVIEDFLSQSAIIIENKINHKVNNDLMDYWNHYQKLSESNRIGILLTKYRVTVPIEAEKHFINITHSEWVTNVKNSIDLSILPLNYQIYLNDFFNTIDNLTKSYTMNESAKFYFQHAQKVVEISKTRSQAVEFINNQFELVAAELGLDAHGSSIDWRNFKDNKNDIHTYLTVITHDLMIGGNQIIIILELFKNDLDKMVELDELLKNHPQYKSKMKGEVKRNYVHYLAAPYHLLPNELENLGETIVEYIRKDFADITLKAIKHNYPNIDISSWENQFTYLKSN